MSEPMQVDEASAPSIIDIKTSPQPQITDAPIPSLPPKPVQVVQEDAQVPQNGTNGTAETELRRGEPPAPAKKMCGVCKEQEMKYRCSKCELPYCSLPCNKKHQEANCTPIIRPPPLAPPVINPHARPGTVAASNTSSIFTPLLTSPALHSLFLRYPSLRSQLRDILAATLPPTHPLSTYGQNTPSRPYQYSYGHKTLPWNQDRGMEGGIEALGQLKGAYGGEGEGVREFCSLALGVVKEGEDGGKGVLEEEMRAEGVRVVRELLQGQL